MQNQWLLSSNRRLLASLVYVSQGHEDLSKHTHNKLEQSHKDVGIIMKHY